MNTNQPAKASSEVWMYSRIGDYTILLFIVLVGLALRLTGITHGIGFHPDERHMVMVTTALEENGMNPKSFAYGSFSYYAAWLLGRMLLPLWPDAMSYDGMFLVGRSFCTLVGLVAVVLTYMLGRLVYKSSAAGLVGAALLSLNVFHIQLSRFFTSDVTLTTLALAALVTLVALYRYDTWHHYLLFGALMGLATATKISSVFLTVPLAVAVYLSLTRDRTPIAAIVELTKAAVLIIAVALLSYAVWQVVVSEHGVVFRSHRISPGGTLILALVPFALIAGAVLQKFSRAASLSLFGVALGGVLFIVAEPFAVLDFPTLVKHTHEQTSMVQGEWRPPYTIQYEHTTPYVYHLCQMFFFTMKWPIFIAAAIGFAAAGARITVGAAQQVTQRKSTNTSQRWGCELILFAFIAVFFLSTGGLQVKFPRYMLPLYPPLFVLAGGLFASFRARTRSSTEAKLEEFEAAGAISS